MVLPIQNFWAKEDLETKKELWTIQKNLEFGIGEHLISSEKTYSKW